MKLGGLYTARMATRTRLPRTSVSHPGDSVLLPTEQVRSNSRCCCFHVDSVNFGTGFRDRQTVTIVNTCFKYFLRTGGSGLGTTRTHSFVDTHGPSAPAWPPTPASDSHVELRGNRCGQSRGRGRREKPAEEAASRVGSSPCS